MPRAGRGIRFAVFNDFRDSSDIRGNHRYFCCHRLQNGPGEALFARGQNEHVKCRKVLPCVRENAQEENAPLQSEPLYFYLDFVSQGTIANDAREGIFGELRGGAYKCRNIL